MNKYEEMETLATSWKMENLRSLFSPINWLNKARLAYRLNQDKASLTQVLESETPYIHWVWLWLCSKLGLFFCLFMAATFSPAAQSFIQAIEKAFDADFTWFIIGLRQSVIVQSVLWLPFILVVAVVFLIVKVNPKTELKTDLKTENNN